MLSVEIATCAHGDVTAADSLANAQRVASVLEQPALSGSLPPVPTVTALARWCCLLAALTSHTPSLQYYLSQLAISILIRHIIVLYPTF